MRILILFAMLNFSVFASNLQMLQISGVKANIDNKQIIIEREIPSECIEFGMVPELFWSEDFASKNVSSKCKKSFITTKGVVLPIKYNENIKTIGELEVLDFIKNRLLKEPQKYALIDVRRESWFKLGTIPTAINIPFDEFEKDEFFMDLFENSMKKLNVKKIDSKYSFKDAKQIVIFCNGAWCKQSFYAINNLIKIGYPQEKILWYRGGIHSWNSMSFTLYKPKSND